MTAPSPDYPPEIVEKVARAIHEARIAFAWGPSAVGVREPWPNFDDGVVRRAYPHNPISYVDLALVSARAALSAMPDRVKLVGYEILTIDALRSTG